jgi:hypothetical protein
MSFTSGSDVDPMPKKQALPVLGAVAWEFADFIASYERVG